jgi:hypothetical protein
MNMEVASSFVKPEGRSAPRIELFGEINCQVMPSATPVVLLDLSAGGFAVASSVPFRPHDEYTFQFRGIRDHGPIRAKDVHCLRVSHGDSGASYVAGFRFVSSVPSERELVDGLVAEANHLIAAPKAS